MLDEVILTPFDEDQLIWAPEKNGIFSVKSATPELDKYSCPQMLLSLKIFGVGLFLAELNSLPGCPSLARSTQRKNWLVLGLSLSQRHYAFFATIKRNLFNTSSFTALFRINYGHGGLICETSNGSFPFI